MPYTLVTFPGVTIRIYTCACVSSEYLSQLFSWSISAILVMYGQVRCLETHNLFDNALSYLPQKRELRPNWFFRKDKVLVLVSPTIKTLLL